MSTVIKVENLSKEYRLGTIGHNYLFRDVQSAWARLRGKEDPNQKIGTGQVAKGKYRALDDVSFEVKQGEVLGIIGRNGAGKSTLLKILSRVTTPTQGSIKVRGRIASLLEVGTGFHPELTGRENIFLNGAILGMSKNEVKAKFDEIVDFAGIGEFIDTPVKRYSSGMYVRLAFAVAAHLEPEILIIDEVLAVGDAEFQKKCLGKMKDVAGQGRTVLFVSHNMAAVQNLCSQCMLMRHGSLQMIGSPSAVIGQYVATADQTGAVCHEIPRESIIIDTGEIGIAKVSLQGTGGQHTNTFLLSEKITCIIEFEVARSVENVVFDLQLGTHVEKISYYLSQDSLNPVSMQPGRYSMIVELENNHLPDTYYLSLAAHQLGNIRTLVLAEQFMQVKILNISVDNASTYPFSVKFGHIKQTSMWHFRQ